MHTTKCCLKWAFNKCGYFSWYNQHTEKPGTERNSARKLQEYEKLKDVPKKNVEVAKEKTRRKSFKQVVLKKIC